MKSQALDWIGLDWSETIKMKATENLLLRHFLKIYFHTTIFQNFKLKILSALLLIYLSSSLNLSYPLLYIVRS